MLRAIRFFFKNNFLRYGSIAVGLLTLLQVIIIVSRIKPASDPISLHYTTYLGVDFVGAWYLVYVLPITSLIFSVINFILAFVLFERDKLLSYILIGAAIIFSGLFLAQSILVVRLNT